MSRIRGDQAFDLETASVAHLNDPPTIDPDADSDAPKSGDLDKAPTSDPPPVFGPLLRHYRETFAERMRSRIPTLPRIKLTALALVECMRKGGYAITTVTLSEIESGANLPRDGRAFFDAVTPCLAIEKESAEWRALIQCLAFDLVRARAGIDVANTTVGGGLDQRHTRSARFTRQPGRPATFGELVRMYRETYGARMRARFPALPDVKLTALALVECLRTHEYPITSATLSEIESGFNLPRDPTAFNRAFAECMQFDEGGPEWRALESYLAFDVVRARAGDEVATLMIERPPVRM